jgi:hypothetical protein
MRKNGSRIRRFGSLNMTLGPTFLILISEAFYLKYVRKMKLRLGNI